MEWLEWRHLALLLLLVALLTAWTYLRSVSTSGSRRNAATVDETSRHDSLELNATDGPLFSLCHPKVVKLTVQDDQMDWFEDKVIDIFNLTVSEWPQSTSRQHEAHARLIDRGVVREGLKNLRAMTADSRVDADPSGWRLHEPLDDIVFARALVATDFDATRAYELVKNYTLWRQNEIKGGVPPSAKWLRLGLACFSFYDKHGRPVVVVRPRNIQRSTPLAVFEEFYRGIVDATIAHMLFGRSRQGDISRTNPLEQYTIVVDTSGCARENFSLDFLKMMVRESNDHYADRVAQIFVLGTGFFVESMWSLASSLVHPRTRRKVCMVSKAKVHEFMRTLVDEDVLPKEWGGRGADNLPTPAGGHFDFKTLAESAGRLSLEVWQQARVLKDGRMRKSVSRDAIPPLINQSFLGLGQLACCFCRVGDEDTKAADRSPRNKSLESAFPMQPASGQIVDLSGVAAADMLAYKQLIQQQKAMLKSIMSELTQHGSKKYDWIWYVFPTDKAGNSDVHRTRVTKQTAVALCHNAPTAGEWQEVLESICDLLEGDLGMKALPQINHGRIYWFLKFWANVDVPPWMTSVCSRLSRFDWPHT
jgi:hypothetical protein